ncbi:centrosomal protein of 164 kDa isoform X2 [Thrips palmi]|uniref:Centrosomal protein of 164 kDa isoform X2 n=1 Tax=Thrips palmi TaxID=161013 RepID=A0A6P8YK71_THRPL|nr:centrosomal protein of 164 kDa isoform X2 [Thrips palmi]
MSMSGPPSLKSLVCEEVFDERSQPSEEEVREYAVRIGIDPTSESHLIPLAREGLLKPLPKNWKPVYDQESKRYYYFNFKTKQTSWEHPLDSKFRDLVKKNRSESLSSAGEEDSKTSIKEELKSFEEAGASIGLEADNSASFKDNPMDFSLQGVPALKSALSPLRTIKKDQESFSSRKDRHRPLSGKSDLRPIFTPKPLFSQSTKPQNSDKIRSKKAEWDDYSSLIDDDSEPLQDIQGHRSGTNTKYGASLDNNVLSHDRRVEPSSSSIIGRFTIDKVHKIDIDSQAKRLDSDGAIDTSRPSDRFLKSGRAEFTLSGGGSVFLKSNKKKDEEKKQEELSNLSDIVGMDFELLKEPNALDSSLRNIKSSVRSLNSSPTISASSTRSILRTPQAEKRLWDVDPQQMSVSEKALWKQQELEEEKKSVRFNLDKELNISFKLSDSSNSDSPSEVEDEEEDEDLDLNSNSSEGLEKDLKLLPSDKSQIPQSSNKQRQMSPLEEWAKETWFSKKPSLDEELKDLAKLDSDFGLCRKTLLDNEKVDQTEDAASALKALKGDEKILESSLDVDIKSLEKSNELLSKQNLELSDIDEFLTSSPMKNNASPAEQDQLSAEARLVESLTKKLKSSYRPTEDVVTSREARAREEAFRNWNVSQTDGETYRPPLSRQQSQQQLQQIKHQIKEPTKVEDRERALRAWNVTDGSDDSVSFSKRISPIRTGLSEDSVLNCASGVSSEYLQGKQSESEVNVEETDKKIPLSLKDSLIVKDVEKELNEDIERLQSEHKIRLEQKKHECNMKFEAELLEITQAHQEKLQKILEEETKKNEKKCKDLVSQMERESDLKMKQIREQLEHKQNCSQQKILEQHQQSLAAQEVENQAAMLRIREQHSADMKTLREQFLREEEQARRDHQEKIANLRDDRDGKRSREVTDHLRSIEKLRCEKRLVEDKYRILKEKYIKLKGEMKANTEKKEQKHKEVNHTDEKTKSNLPSNIEPELSPQFQQPSDRSETESRPKTVSAGSSDTSKSLGFQQFQVQHQEQTVLQDPPSPAPNSGPSGVTCNNINDSSIPNVPFLGMSFCKPPFQEKSWASNRNGIPTLQSSWNNHPYFTTERNGNILTNEETQWNPPNFNTTTSHQFSPLEALRYQLKTLDELEEQFPVSSVTDAYLRYPFSDAAPKKLESAELEFFRHRIHLERDMIRQAKSTLQAQQSEYRTRMHNFQLRQTSSKVAAPSSTLYQMAKEEQELSDMESKLQRTRTILSEKMVHLRHLEDSLNHLTGPSMRTELNGRRGNGVPETRHAEKPKLKQHRRWDWKAGGLGVEDVSDEVSSDSGGSSGFSSTEYASDGTLASLLTHSGSGPRFKHNPENTADINLSLHNLNAEISEIWNVLCKQRAAAGLGPPPLLGTQAAGMSSTSQNYHQTSASAARVSSPTITPSISKVIQDKNSSLIERTNNLRQWLQKAKMSASLPSAPSREKNEVSF